MMMLAALGRRSAALRPAARVATDRLSLSSRGLAAGQGTGAAARHLEREAATPPRITSARVVAGSSLEITWEGRSAAEVYHGAWLRHNAPDAVDPSSGQKRAFYGDHFGPGMLSACVDPENNGQVVVRWSAQEGDTNAFPAEWLLRRGQPGLAVGGTTSSAFEVADVCQDDEQLCQWLRRLADEGWALLRGGGPEAGVVVKLADRISAPQVTMYGTTFDVEAVPSPINIAYSTQGLVLHQDLVYLESPPGLQFLHCRAFDDSVTGGNSTLMDGFAVAERLREVSPEDFRTLCRVPATFQKIHYDRPSPVHMTYRRPHIGVHEGTGRVTSVTWAPPFEGVLSVNHADTAAYYQAYARFTAVIKESTDLCVELRLAPGEVLTFNNRRMLHGRRAFDLDVSGHRHLEGCYVNIDEFKSRLMYLCDTHHLPVPLGGLVVGNQDVPPSL